EHLFCYDQTIAKTDNNAILASVWDEVNESYSGNKNITVYRSPSCGCCGEWIKHLEKHGFQVTDLKTDKIEAIKQENNISSDLASCHTGIIDGYVMEGHIPADDIKRFLTEKPDWQGLTVPQMPLGSPGMESGDRKQPFDVLAFNNKGKIKVFQQHENY
ncbi:MAG TPA: metal-binding protein, partial [Cyanothece sp. UBA12306]|nr:metal-binding protein [Cyanothece sp. UBA12306]